MTRQKIILIKNVWTLVMQNVTTGIIDLNKSNAVYYKYDFVPTGNNAPSNDNTAVIFHGIQESINSSGPIDVYVKCSNENGEIIVTY